MPERNETPMAAGKRWAEDRVESLEDNIPAVDWPDIWPPDWDEELELPQEVNERDAPTYRAVAHHAAAERWAELLAEHRDAEAVPDELAEAEVEAARLVELLQSDLPAGLVVGREGPRAYLRDHGDEEWTIRSLQEAWRVVAEYKERHTS